MLTTLLTTTRRLSYVLLGLLVLFGHVLLRPRPELMGWGVLSLGLLLLLVGLDGALGGFDFSAGASKRVWLPELPVSWRALLTWVVLAVGLASLWTFYLNPANPSSLFFDRHSLPYEVPLPDGVVFVSYSSSGLMCASLQSGFQSYADRWLWASPDSPAKVQQFYEHNPLPSPLSDGPYWVVAVASQVGMAHAPPGGALLLLTRNGWIPCPGA